MQNPVYPTHPILIVDDEINVLRSIEITLHSEGINHTLICEDSRKVLDIVSEQEIGLIIMDLSMPHIRGEELIPDLIRNSPQTPIIVITGFNEVELAVSCMKLGISDYMVKPVEGSRLVSGVRHQLELQELKRDNLKIKNQLINNELCRPEDFSTLITNNARMIAIFKYVEVVADSREPILITGETGVGKELVARAIHTSSRRAGPFVPVNLSGLDDNMFSDTLFGHVKGAFTDASQERPGLIESAADGTIFLDEIGELPDASQLKLLRLLEEGEYYQLGSDIIKHTNAAVVTATNRQLAELRSTKSFRRDLFYRLNVHHIHLPPLRERKGDIPLLFRHFLEASAQAMARNIPTVPDELFQLLEKFKFPGNIRQLRSMVVNAISQHRGGVLSLKSFRQAIGDTLASDPYLNESAVIDLTGQNSPEISGDLLSLKEAEAILIRKAMESAAGNQGIAAQLLGISRQTLNRKLKHL